jgi:hypothetical protein
MQKRAGNVRGNKIRAVILDSCVSKPRSAKRASVSALIQPERSQESDASNQRRQTGHQEKESDR